MNVCTGCLVVKGIYEEKRAKGGEVSSLMFFFVIIKWGKLVKKLEEGTG